jgi:hypothetical protein
MELEIEWLTYQPHYADLLLHTNDDHGIYIVKQLQNWLCSVDKDDDQYKWRLVNHHEQSNDYEQTSHHILFQTTQSLSNSKERLDQVLRTTFVQHCAVNSALLQLRRLFNKIDPRDILVLRLLTPALSSQDQVMGYQYQVQRLLHSNDNSNIVTWQKWFSSLFRFKKSKRYYGDSVVITHSVIQNKKS